MTWRPFELQITKTRDFLKSCIAKTATPQTRQEQLETSKMNRILPTASVNTRSEDFYNILLVRWENQLSSQTQVTKNGHKWYFCKKLNKILLRPTRELINFSKSFALSVLTQKQPPALRKIHTLRKKKSKRPKINLPVMFSDCLRKAAFFNKKRWE